MFSGLKPPIQIDFETETELSCDDVCQLKIDARGHSPYYPDSYFTVKYNHFRYNIMRHQSIELSPLHLPHLNQNRYITIQSFREFEDKKKEPEFPPIYAIDEFPEDYLIGTGNMGQVHLVLLGTTPLALKIARIPHDVKQGCTLTLKPTKVPLGAVLVPPLPDANMPDSFLKSFIYWESSKNIHSEFIAEIKGLAFIKDLNQWGVLYEYIDGYSFNQFCIQLKTHTHKQYKIIDISLQLAEALKILDDAGQPHTDLLNPNILIRKSNHFPVLIDYGGDYSREYRSVLSRQQFGKRLSQLTQVLEENSSELGQLAIDCQTNQTFDELSWKIIIDRLNHIKSSTKRTEDKPLSTCHWAGFFGLKNRAGDPMPLNIKRQCP